MPENIMRQQISSRMAVVLQYHQSAGAKWFDPPTCVAIRNFTEQAPHMVSSAYSEAAIVTGVTHFMKFSSRHEKCMKFVFRVLEIIPHRVYRLRRGKLHNFA